jgi:pantoate--beta-alanine ligase
MGFLHEGHASLIEVAARENDFVVVSDFVNPLQFGANEDFATYPKDLQNDARVAESAGADLIFHPSADELYQCDYINDHQNLTVVNAPSNLADTLCGITRPGHFDGVCTVVNKLFNIVTPDVAYFGQKDAQQLAIIKKMVADLNMNVVVKGCPIVRDVDGLAKSSRNSYLSPDERAAALCLSRAIERAKLLIESGETGGQKLVREAKSIIDTEPRAEIEYIKLVDPDSLREVEGLDTSAMLVLAVKIGKTRLIDNSILVG